MKSPKWPESKYYGMTKEEIKKSWNDNGDNAAKLGTDMHKMFEDYYNGLEVQGGIKWSSVYNNGGQLQNIGWHFTSNLNRQETWLKIGKLYRGKPWKSMGLQLAGFIHQQDLHCYNK